MAGLVALSGQDTVSINNYVFSDYADDNYAELTFPNEIANMKIGKNGNAIYGLNTTGIMSDLKLRLLRGSNDDKFLLNLLNQQQINFASTVLMIGTFVKQIGLGNGSIVSDTYVLSGGIFPKQVEGKSNASGETEQSVAIYMMKFTCQRVLT